MFSCGNDGESFLPGTDSFGSVAFATMSIVLVFANRTTIMLVIPELDLGLFKMKLLNNTSKKRILF